MNTSPSPDTNLFPPLPGPPGATSVRIRLPALSAPTVILEPSLVTPSSDPDELYPLDEDDSGEDDHSSSRDTHTTNNTSNVAPSSAGDKEKVGRWSEKEHLVFLDGLHTYGKQWKTIAGMIGTRTVVQVRTHAQKYFQKMERSNGALDYVSTTTTAAAAAPPRPTKATPPSPPTGRPVPHQTKRKSLPSSMPSRKKSRKMSARLSMGTRASSATPFATAGPAQFVYQDATEL